MNLKRILTKEYIERERKKQKEQERKKKRDMKKLTRYLVSSGAIR